MELHRQQCQACGGYDMRDILVREESHPTVIYVRCIRCSSLVARYELSDYYHHGKGIESYLRSRGAAAAESGRRILEEFASARRRAVEGYERALRALAAEGKDVDPAGPVPPPGGPGDAAADPAG
ncbi:MAG: hypothetical protein ACYTG1_09440 [Planctomycetota bacterium]|jgi:hypothetical protein